MRKNKAHRIGFRVCPTVDAVVGSIEATFREPDDVSVLEAACPDGFERAAPVKHLIRGLKTKRASIDPVPALAEAL